MLGNLPADYKRQEQKAIKQGKDYDKPYVAIPRNFNKAMGVLNNVLGVGASTALRIADFLEDPLNLDPETPGRTEILAGLAGEAAQEGLNQGEGYLLDKGVHPTHVESIGHAVELADLVIGSRGSRSVAKAATKTPLKIRKGRTTMFSPSRRNKYGQWGEVGAVNPKKVRQETDLRISDASTPEGVERIFKRKIRHPNQHGGMPEKGTHLHHLVQKRVSTPIHRKMQDLQKQGLFPLEDPYQPQYFCES